MEQNISQENTATVEKSRKWVAIVALFLLMSIILVVSGYYLWSVLTREYDDKKSERTEISQSEPDQIGSDDNEKDESVEDKANISSETETEQNSTGEGNGTITTEQWLTYRSDPLGISFKYPSTMSVKENENFIQILIMVEDSTGTAPDKQFELIKVGKKVEAPTYGNGPEESNPAAMPPLTIDGQQRVFDRYIIGEGSLGYGFYIETFWTKLNDQYSTQVQIGREHSEPTCWPDEASEPVCNNRTFNYTTDHSDLPVARAILSTMDLD